MNKVLKCFETRLKRFFVTFFSPKMCINLPCRERRQPFGASSANPQPSLGCQFDYRCVCRDQLCCWVKIHDIRHPKLRPISFRLHRVQVDTPCHDIRQVSARCFPRNVMRILRKPLWRLHDGLSGCFSKLFQAYSPATVASVTRVFVTIPVAFPASCANLKIEST